MKKSFPISFLFPSSNDSQSERRILPIYLQASRVKLSLHAAKVLPHSTGLSSINDINNYRSTSQISEAMEDTFNTCTLNGRWITTGLHDHHSVNKGTMWNQRVLHCVSFYIISVNLTCSVNLRWEANSAVYGYRICYFKADGTCEDLLWPTRWKKVTYERGLIVHKSIFWL